MKDIIISQKNNIFLKLRESHEGHETFLVPMSSVLKITSNDNVMDWSMVTLINDSDRQYWLKGKYIEIIEFLK